MKNKAFQVLWMMLLFIGGTTFIAQAQTTEVDRTKYPDYSDKVNPDWSLMSGVKKSSDVKGITVKSETSSERPAYVHNGKNKHFPPVFNQDGGSCGSASRICYMFSYELATYRNIEGTSAENYYPSHFVWLHTYSPTGIVNQGKEGFVMHVGVPSAATYGGQTYSSLFGYQEADSEEFGWMQGYDKWFEAMHNRMVQPVNFPLTVETEEGREAVKNWLWNHNGDDSFAAGGICGIGVASGGVWENIPSTEANDAAGVTGLKFVREWGISTDHALTIVGYDDRIEFDLDKDGVYGETDADEVGAWIIVNSWGGWCNDGFIYCPYAFAGPMFNNDGDAGSRTFNSNNWWQPEIYKVRKDYRPLRTIKLKMDYSRRSEIALSAGISADVNATEPEKTVPFVHFTYAGDGNYGNTNPAPEIPMLGRWADGQLHTEPMEFGYDLTDLTEGYDMSQPLKYFFIVNTRDWALGSGTLYDASIMDYQLNELGVETPFGVGEGVEIQSAGEQTIISVVVQGNGLYAPKNLVYNEGVLTWQAPTTSAATLEGYRVYVDGTLLEELESTTTTYTLTTTDVATYGVSAVYSGDNESELITVKSPMTLSSPNEGLLFANGGFTIPNVFSSSYQQATLEYWIKPTSLTNYNQMGGPGWGTFHFHANSDGHFTAGWNYMDTERVNTNTSLVAGTWTHVAMVIDGSTFTVYLDGVNCGSITSSNFSGVGGFGNLVFTGSGSNAQDAAYDEIRIWNTARTAEQINAYKNAEFVGTTAPTGLMAYFKGDVFTDAEGNTVMRDHVGENHATLQGTAPTATSNDLTSLSASAETPTVSINAPSTTVYVGVPVVLTASYNDAVAQLKWTAADAGVTDLQVVSPTLTFNNAGTQTVTVTAANGAGTTTTATLDIDVQAAPAPDASFTMVATQVPAGETVTFAATNVLTGYIYTWSMPGANSTSASTASVATAYDQRGTFDVTLTVTAPDGNSASTTQQITVIEVAPVAAFSISPAVVVKGDTLMLTDESKYSPAQWVWHIANDNNNYMVYDQNKALTIDAPGVYSVTLNVTNNAGSDEVTRERALIVTNADSENGLNFSNERAVVTATTSPIEAAQTAFTIEWWMNSDWPADNINGIGDTESTLLLCTMSDGKMKLSVGGNSVMTGTDYVVAGEWHHYGVVYDAGTVKFYRDAELISTQTMADGTTIPTLSAFCIGGETAPFSGSIDELRVWASALSESNLSTYANAPITDVTTAENDLALKLYYNFNQTEGNVTDATSNANTGTRTNFGPDGDAWGLSKGVFCLSESTGTDITSQYFTNYQKTFTNAGTTVNTANSTRFLAITDWTLENTIVSTSGDTITGAHVDKNKSYCLTVTTGWDGFSSSLSDHKVFQTVTLPAGYYTFQAEYDNYYEGQCGSSYVVAAVGNTLPTTENLAQALAYTAMKAKGVASVNAVGFLLTEETTVSLGLLVNMSGSLCMNIQKFTLLQKPLTIHEKVDVPITSVEQLMNTQLYYVSQPNHAYGTTAWAVQTDGTSLTTTHALSASNDKTDVQQQFAFITNDNAQTHYLYHPAEQKYVNKDGSLSVQPTDPVLFKAGAYDSTFIVYFDDTHYINVNGYRNIVISNYTNPDGGNSCALLPVGEFDPTDALNAFPHDCYLTDATDYEQAEDVRTTSVTLTRNFGSTNWQAWYVPFDVPYDDISADFTAATLNDIHQFDDDDDGTFERWTLEILKMRSGDVLYANKPYMIRAKQTGEYNFVQEDAILYKAEENSLDCSSINMLYTFTGTYHALSGAELAANGCYGMGGGALVTPTETTTLKPFRWFLKAESRDGYTVARMPKQILVYDGDVWDDATDIEVLPVQGDAVYDVYDLNGRCVKKQATNLNGLPKGIYIVNGKKILK